VIRISIAPTTSAVQRKRTAAFHSPEPVIYSQYVRSQMPILKPHFGPETVQWPIGRVEMPEEEAALRRTETDMIIVHNAVDYHPFIV
jgi:hypothetical protein